MVTPAHADRGLRLSSIFAAGFGLRGLVSSVHYGVRLGDAASPGRNAAISPAEALDIMEPRLPDALIKRLTDRDRSALEQMIGRYPFLTEDIITHDDYQNLRKDFEVEKAALREQIRVLNSQIEHFAQLLRGARAQVTEWATWRTGTR